MLIISNSYHISRQDVSAYHEESKHCKEIFINQRLQVANKKLTIISNILQIQLIT